MQDQVKANESLEPQKEPPSKGAVLQFPPQVRVEVALRPGEPSRVPLDDPYHSQR